MTQLLDGGLSTELERIGARFDGTLWTGRTLLDDPALIEQAHRNFVEAGADIIITSSYQLSRQGFTAIGLSEDDADAALRCSVEIARRATANSNTRVAASIGPYGAILHDGSEYRGDYGVNREALYRFHAERIAILNEAAPDLLLAETIPDFVETQALARALGEVDRPIGFSFNSSDGTTLCSGASLVEAIETIQGIPHLEFIGFNCVAPEIVSDLVTAARAISSTPIAIYPNKGGLWDPHTGNWSDQGTRPLEDWWREWSMLGIEYIGGCCGTDAETISTLRHHLDSGDSKNSSSI